MVFTENPALIVKWAFDCAEVQKKNNIFGSYHSSCITSQPESASADYVSQFQTLWTHVCDTRWHGEKNNSISSKQEVQEVNLYTFSVGPGEL